MEFSKISSTSDACINEESQPGHLLYECLDSCLLNSHLSDINGVKFPGAFGREPIGTVWKAWTAVSIFASSDLDLGKKIGLYREGATCLDAKSLEKALLLAFEKCTSWTESICSKSGVKKHAPVRSYDVQKLYDEALKAVKLEMALTEKSQWPRKHGPVAFLAPRCAGSLEKDGLRCGVMTKVIVQFSQLKGAREAEELPSLDHRLATRSEKKTKPLRVQ
ncbi:unnamed protein product [Cylicostephanus goldi]|uniref:Uncharacterized protein n=1 Tax=Cylicostephanus goldi TaxID=71465 RepID=A0A3P6RRW8_CYLGO|nr:unnamed protein product [Cylicostephanus goldi]